MSQNEKKVTLRTLVDSEAALTRWMDNAHPADERLGWRVGQILGSTEPLIGPRSKFRLTEQKVLAKHAKFIKGTGWMFEDGQTRVAFDNEMAGLLDEEVTIVLPLLLTFETVKQLHIEPKPTPREQFALSWLIDPSDLDAPKSPNAA